MATLARLLSLSFFFFLFCPFSLKVFQEYIGRERERERAIQKKDTEQKGERESQSNIEKEGNAVEKMKSGTLERRERT